MGLTRQGPLGCWQDNIDLGLVCFICVSLISLLDYDDEVKIMSQSSLYPSAQGIAWLIKSRQRAWERLYVSVHSNSNLSKISLV